MSPEVVTTTLNTFRQVPPHTISMSFHENYELLLVIDTIIIERIMRGMIGYDRMINETGAWSSD